MVIVSDADFMEKYGKHTFVGWSWRILLGMVLTPIFVLLLLFVLIYVPPVQKWAVNTAAEILSEEMGMEVSVEHVRLKFPLDLSVGGLLVVEEGDTVLAARELDVSVRALPLFRLEAEVDGVHLYDTKLNTKELISVGVLKGSLAELSLNSHSTDIKNGLAVINEALLRDADLTFLLADSVPEDTTTTDWRVRLDNLKLQRVKVNVLLTPNADSTWVMADIGGMQTKAYLDLKEGAYHVDGLDITNSKVAYDRRKEPRLPQQLDPNHLLFENINMRVDSLSAVGQDLSMCLSRFVATEQSGLVITELTSCLEMDSVSLTIPKLHMKTADSDLTVAYKMDMNAFDEVNPGRFSVLGEGQVGKGDMIYFTRMGGSDTKDVCTMMNQMLPVRPSEVRLKAEGNLETLDVSTLYLKVPGLAVVDGEAVLRDVVNDLSLETKLKAEDLRGGSVDVKAGYVMAQEAYRADVRLNRFVVNHFVPMDKLTELSGHLKADGHGFDFFSKATVLHANAVLTDAHMGQMNLGNITANATMKGDKMLLDVTADNDQLQTDLAFDGVLKRNLLEGFLNLHLPWADVQGMGFSENVLQANTSGTMQFSYNLDKFFHVDSHIDALKLTLAGGSIQTDAFNLLAEAKKDTTWATLQTGDLDFSFFTPNNMFNLLPKVERLEKEVVKQFKRRDVDLNVLRSYLPELRLYASAGRRNPVSDVLKLYGMRFDEVMAQVEASPETGLVGQAHIYAFQKDSVRVDTAFFDLAQDSAKLDYHLGVLCQEQRLLPAFRAYIDGFLKADEVDSHLTFFDKKGRVGIDFGVNGVATDSCVNFSLYPQHPILAYREFALNSDNYIVTCPDRPIMADVRLTSVKDSAYVAVYADESDIGKQIANVIVNDLNLKEILTVLPIPGLPNMTGMLAADATYIDQGENFLVEGTLDVDRFTYEGMSVGNLGTRFTYMPQGETMHTVDATLALNDQDIIQLDGTYQTEDEGTLDAKMSLMDVPMSVLDAFIPNQVVNFNGLLAGNLKVTGPMSALLFNGALHPKEVHVLSKPYSFDLALDNQPIPFTNSRIDFTDFKFYGADDNPLTLSGYVDFADFGGIVTSLSLMGRNFKVIEAKPAANSLLYGDMYGDFFVRVLGSTGDNMTVRGLVRVLPTTNITYVLTDTPLYQTDRLEDIVTFVNFNAPPPPREEMVKKTFMGIDMNLVLSIEDGAKLNADLSADHESYVKVQGGGSVTMTYTPEGVLNLQGRYTINEGEMKYTLPVIPLKTFTIHNGSYIEFTGEPANPVLNIAATERVKATVGETDGTSRSVAFDAGLKISNTLSNMGLEFTIDAPEDISVQNELAACSAEEKNKLAVGMLATGMYLSGYNKKGFTAGNALNSFLQNEINNIAGKAMSTMVDVNVGMEQTTRDDGTTRTDYSFKFSRRFFSDRLNVVIGGKVSSDGGSEQYNESGAYIDDVSLEWRLDNGGTQYVRLFHEKDYSNLIEGELDKNGTGVLLRKKMDKFSDLFIWRKKTEEPHRTRSEEQESRNGKREGDNREQEERSEAETETTDRNITQQ